MKTIVGILAITFFFSCNNDIEKPDRIIKEKQMVDILYDMALLQAMNSYAPKQMADSNIVAKKYIYKKYDIDSATFAQNHKYYATNIEGYQQIQNQVANRLKDRKREIDSVYLKENPVEKLSNNRKKASVVKQ